MQGEAEAEKDCSTGGAAVPALHFARLSLAARPPFRATQLSAGYDLFAAEGVEVPPGGSAALVRTGLALALPADSVGFVKSRSSLAARHDVEAGAGVIDADYRGEVSVLLRNFGTFPFAVRAGERIAQLVVLPLHALHGGAAREVAFPAELGATRRGQGGFGSTGST